MLRHPVMQICGVRSKQTGMPCRQYPMPGRTRCKWHGGTTPFGLVRNRNMRPARAGADKRVALLHAFGLKWYGGRPRKREKVLTMAEEAKANLQQQIAVLEETLLPDIQSRPIESLTAGEALGRATLSGMQQLVRIVETPLPDTEYTGLWAQDAMKQVRLIGDMAAAAGRLSMRAAESTFKAQSNDRLGEILAIIRAEKEKG